MLVIDSHAHPPRKGVPGIDNRPRTIPKSLEQIDKIFIEDVNEIIEDMDRHQVDAKVMIAMPPDIEKDFHYGEYIPEYGITTMTSHEWISRAIALYPNRFFACACLNPLEENSREELEDLVVNKGFREVKIHQAHYRFEVNDKRVYPFYEKCIELDIPVAFHTGFSPVQLIDRSRRYGMV